MVFDQPPSNQNEKSKKIADLRVAISRAEKNQDEKKVLLLESELRALEKGEEFDKEKFLEEQARANIRIRAKHDVLRDMRELPTAENDHWQYDGITQDYKYSYERTFSDLLPELDVQDFEGFVDRRHQEQKRGQKVLDLFGGAYFLEDLSPVSKIVGVRLNNIDKKLANDPEINEGERQIVLSLINNPKRVVLEGNLYKSKTWDAIKEEDQKSDGKGFDLIVCRPEGPFGNSGIKNIKDVADGDSGDAKEKIFVILLEKTLKLLSEDDGILFSQVPDMGPGNSILEFESDLFDTDLYKKLLYYASIKEKEGYKFFFGRSSGRPPRLVFAVKRTKLYT